jgi:hypothetical protein
MGVVFKGACLAADFSLLFDVIDDYLLRRIYRRKVQLIKRSVQGLTMRLQIMDFAKQPDTQCPDFCSLPF